VSVTPAPWAADTPTLLSNTLGHIVRAWVTVSGGSDVDLQVTDGSVSFDESRTPRVTADLTCAIPAADALRTIDPRMAGRRVVIQAGYRRPDGTEDVQTLANLMLRGRSLNYPANTMRLTAASDEAKIMDAAPADLFTLSETGAQNAIARLLESAGLSYILQGAATADLTAFSIDPVNDLWDAIEDVCDQIGADFYATAARENEYQIDYRPTLATTPAYTVTTGAAGTMTDGAHSIDRDGWFNAVYIEYRWRAWNNLDALIFARADATGTYAPTAGNRRILKLTRNTPTTATKAATAAQTLANRQATKGRAMDLTAVSAYWLRPGDTVAGKLPDRDTERHLLSSVTFRLADGLMDLSTRLPE
jgi:hypothetical protein